MGVSTCRFCNVRLCVCVAFVMCGYVYALLSVCVGGFNVWVCLRVGFVMCGCLYEWVL